MEKVYFIGRDTVPEKLVLEAGAQERLIFIVLPEVSAQVPIRVELNGEGANVELDGFFICGSNEKVSFNIDLHHNASHTYSYQFINGIAGGGAHSEFNGRIVVHEGICGIKAFQENHNILLSDSAIVASSPQLEIYSDDVECSHGATSGFLNIDEQFYMRSRGIPEDEAKALQMISFLAPVISKISDGGLREKIAETVEKAVRKIIP